MTPIMRKAFDYIVAYRAVHKTSPSYAAIGRHLGVRRDSALHTVDRLVERQRIARHRYAPKRGAAPRIELFPIFRFPPVIVPTASSESPQSESTVRPCGAAPLPRPQSPVATVEGPPSIPRLSPQARAPLPSGRAGRRAALSSATASAPR